MSDLRRIALALERIADALEQKPGLTSPVTLMLDGKTLARSVISYSLKRAARGPSSLTGGTLSTGKPDGKS